MCASNAARAIAMTTAGRVVATRSPHAARKAVGTTSGRAYRVVTDSWNSRSNTAYGPNATTSVVNADAFARYRRTAPRIARTNMTAATHGTAHGATGALFSATNS